MRFPSNCISSVKSLFSKFQHFLNKFYSMLPLAVTYVLLRQDIDSLRNYLFRQIERVPDRIDNNWSVNGGFSCTDGVEDESWVSFRQFLPNAKKVALCFVKIVQTNEKWRKTKQNAFFCFISERRVQTQGNRSHRSFVQITHIERVAKIKNYEWRW